MSKSTVLALAVASSTLLLAACGGGSSSTQTVQAAPVVQAVSTFALQAGYKARIASGSATNFSISGTCTGSSNISSSSPKTGTFEGAAALTVTTTESVTFTNCTPTSGAYTSVSYYDSSYNPLGHSSIGLEYGKFLITPNALPTSVKVGDTAVFGTETIYSDSTKQVTKGQRTRSYVIEADGVSGSTAIINLITKNFNLSNQLLFTQQSRFRMTTDGKLTDLSIDVQASTTSTNHFLYTAN